MFARFRARHQVSEFLVCRMITFTFCGSLTASEGNVFNVLIRLSQGLR